MLTDKLTNYFVLVPYLNFFYCYTAALSKQWSTKTKLVEVGRENLKPAILCLRAVKTYGSLFVKSYFCDSFQLRKPQSF